MYYFVTIINLFYDLFWMNLEYFLNKLMYSMILLLQEIRCIPKIMNIINELFQNESEGQNKIDYCMEVFLAFNAFLLFV